MQFTLLTALLASGAAAVPTSRSLQARYAVKERHVVPRGWTVAAPAPKSHILNLQFGLKQNNQDVLDKHILETSNPSHARYGQHLSAQEVKALIAPSDETVRMVQDWLAENDLVGSLSAAGDWIKVRIPVEQAEKLLDTTYSTYSHKDGATLVRTPEWSLPEYLHEHIDVVQPTNSFFRGAKQSSDLVPETHGGQDWKSWQPSWWQHHHPKPPPYNPSGSGATPDVSAVCNVTFTTLECLRTLYGTINYVPKVPEKNAIGVTNYLGETQNRSDLAVYLNNFRPEAAAYAYEFPIISVNGGVDDQSRLPADVIAARGQDVEGALDGDLAVGITYPTKFQSWVTAGEPPFTPDLAEPIGPDGVNEPYLDWLNFVLASDDIPQVISTSYGDDEQTVPYSYAVRVCDGFKQLGAQGVSVLFSSGDSGVGPKGECFLNTDNKTAAFLPAFPTSCPWVTSVGGTANFTPEVAVSRFGSGAGFSNYFPQPAYQHSAVEGYLAKIGNLYAGLYNRTGRAYPDVAAQGNHDVIAYAGNLTTVGGTSASSPTFAAVLALVNDALIAAGRPSLGFINPWIYANGYKALNDILSGSAIGCNVTGFPAEVGWDAVTGYGTPNFGKLVQSAFANGPKGGKHG